MEAAPDPAPFQAATPRQADDHDIHALHGLPPSPVILFLSRLGEPFRELRSSGTSPTPNDILTLNLSVYRQTDDCLVVKRELFLFRLPACVYAE